MNRCRGAYLAELRNKSQTIREDGTENLGSRRDSRAAKGLKLLQFGPGIFLSAVCPPFLNALIWWY